jgi:hypothetical protein
MTQTKPATPAHNNDLDDALADAKRLLTVLNFVANETLEDDDDNQQMLFAII